MTFDSSIFWGAFKDAGMLVAATYQPAVGDLVEFDVGFNRPDQVVLDGVAHSTQASIEYQAVDIELRRGAVVKVDGVDYKVSQPPMAKDDGTFMLAYVEKVT